MNAGQLVWVGIDAGKITHHAAAVNAAGEVVWSRRVRNDQAAIETLVAKATEDGVQVHWAVDLK